MKTSLTIVFLLLIGLNLNSQTMEKQYINHLQGLPHPRPGVKQPFELRFVPRPKKIWVHGHKVTVTYDKKEWNRAQFLNRQRVAKISVKNKSIK